MCVNRIEKELNAVDYITFCLNVLGLSVSDYCELHRCSSESESSVIIRLWLTEQEKNKPVIEVIPATVCTPIRISPIKLTRSSPNWKSR